MKPLDSLLSSLKNCSVSSGQGLEARWNLCLPCRERFAARSDWKNAYSKSHTTLLSSSCFCLLYCASDIMPPSPASHTIVCLFLCVWYGDTMGSVYLFYFLTLCLLPLWFLLSTEENWVAIQGCLIQGKIPSALGILFNLWPRWAPTFSTLSWENAWANLHPLSYFPYFFFNHSSGRGSLRIDS